ncbi:VOC family protein [Streptomyces sp. TRM70308]|uniref:VOC family protein n=1 Tax=Streptomyces sp. TRM70308 TaxID=3131932 RepID=UPI003D05B3D5
MAAHPDGVPCWADAVVPDLAAARHFYGELFGWTYAADPAAPRTRTGAFRDGRAVAALVPRTPRTPDPEAPHAVWTLYYAADDADATAARVREHGGELLVAPVDVAGFGRVCVARDPGGAVFGVRQPGTRPGFAACSGPGTYAWAEVRTRDAGAVDAFYPAVFPGLRPRPAPDASADRVVWEVGGTPVATRCRMDARWPVRTPAHTAVHFAVDDCDAAVTAVPRLGGRLVHGPVDTPGGRLAGVADQQGAVFSVIDLSRRSGAPPR